MKKCLKFPVLVSLYSQNFTISPHFLSQVPDVEGMLAAPLAGQGAAVLERKPSQSEDLFSAHNFDITINLDIPAPGKTLALNSIFTDEDKR